MDVNQELNLLLKCTKKSRGGRRSGGGCEPRIEDYCKNEKEVGWGSGRGVMVVVKEELKLL